MALPVVPVGPAGRAVLLKTKVPLIAGMLSWFLRLRMISTPAFTLWLPMTLEKSSFQSKIRLKLLKFRAVAFSAVSVEG